MTTASEVGPFFVGGTGRSGTTIAAQLIGADRRVALVPVELRLHVDRGGLSELAAGHQTLEGFVRRLRRTWFERRPNRSGPRGLHVITPRAQMRQAIGQLREQYADEPWDACGRFLDSLIRPWCERHGATTWVEMTPPNASAMDALTRMLPTSRLVHMVRDGRDVAASVARRSWGPDTVEEALAWWADSLIKIDAARQRADPARVHAVRLESLVGPHREEHLSTLATFLGLDADEGMRSFFDADVTAGASHAGAWRGMQDLESCRRIDELYEAQLARLADAGVELPAPD